MAIRPVNDSQRENYKSNYDTYGFGGGIQPQSSPYDQERKLAAQMVFGSARHSQRGAEAQLEQQGLGGIPGLQSAVAGQARAQSLSSLEGMNRDIGNRELQTQRLQNAHSEALRREKEAKDEASKARWGAIAAKLGAAVSAAVIIGATGGTAGAALLGGGKMFLGLNPFAEAQKTALNTGTPTMGLPAPNTSVQGFRLGGFGNSWSQPETNNGQPGRGRLWGFDD